MDCINPDVMKRLSTMRRPIFYVDVDVISVVVAKTWAAGDVRPEDAILAAVLGVVNDEGDTKVLCDIANTTGEFIKKTWKTIRPKHDFAGYAIIDDGGEPRPIRSFAEPRDSEDQYDWFRVDVYFRGASDTALNKLGDNLGRGKVRDVLSNHGFIIQNWRIHEERAPR